MTQITITEALAELNTIGKRLEKKSQFQLDYLMRPEQVRDPLEKDGGTVQIIFREWQAIRDLEERVIKIRREISLANHANVISIVTSNQSRTTRTIADWLVWKREVAKWHQALLAKIRAKIDQQRQQVVRSGGTLASGVDNAKPGDI